MTKFQKKLILVLMPANEPLGSLGSRCVCTTEKVTGSCFMWVLFVARADWRRWTVSMEAVSCHLGIIERRNRSQQAICLPGNPASTTTATPTYLYHCHSSYWHKAGNLHIFPLAGLADTDGTALHFESGQCWTISWQYHDSRLWWWWEWGGQQMVELGQPALPTETKQTRLHNQTFLLLFR